MGPGSTDGVVARCAGVAGEADELAGRVRGLPPPSWTGPAAAELEQGVRRAAGLIDDGAAAVERAAAAARSVAAG